MRGRYRLRARRRRVINTVITVASIAVAVLIIMLVWSTAGKTGGRQGQIIIEKSPHRNTSLSGVIIDFYNPETKEIEKIELEEYTLGVVSAEMPASFAPEALKAQAIAARTFAVYKMEHGGCASNPGADVCGNSQCCQAYSGDAARRKKWGEAYSANMAKLADAVSAVSGLIITYEGEPIQVLYHSTSGGMTEDVENVFSQALPYLRSVESPGEEGYPRYTSTVRMGVSEFMEKLKKSFPKAEERKIRDITVTRFESGRVDKIKMCGITASGREFRKIFGLDSTNFTVTVSGSEVVFQTKGYGHGVGMSQVGADSMAKNGAGYDEILLHYYQGVKIEEYKG